MNRLFQKTKEIPKKQVLYAGENYWDAMRFREHNIIPIKKPVSEYVRLDAADCAARLKPPNCAKMLTREFIHDSLYNPNYGYFSKKAIIFSTPSGIQFNDFKDNYAFLDYVSQLYKDIEEDYHDSNDIARQIWHTPTELFKPWYGYSLADYMLKEFPKMNTEKLIIYETGAGNGTLMTNILDYLQDNCPDVYKRTEYNIIEISSKLAHEQQSRMDLASASRKHQCVNVVNKSIFEWDQLVSEPCFFLAMEVIDNFAHDLVRYEYKTNRPVQGMVLVDETGDYEEAYEYVNDYKLLAALETVKKSGFVSPVARNAPFRKILASTIPFSPNLTQPEYIPTNCFEFFDVLFKYFPRHKLCLSDFSTLDNTVKGWNAPVVQTRYQGTMIPCSSYLVQPGWFDIFFPTNFDLIQAVYQLKSPVNQPISRSSTRILDQKDFLLEYSSKIRETTTKSGDNPMLSFYENMKFFLS